MAVNALGTSTDISQLASRLMNRVDTNNDGQLSKEEFGSFLTSLLDGVSQATPAAAASRSVVAPTSLTSLALSGGYQPIPGFDSGKLNDPTHTTPKYMFARAVQDLGLLGTPTGNLQSVVDQYNKATGKSATVKGDDTIDFGGDIGVVDVIFSVGGSDARWQWCPTA